MAILQATADRQLGITVMNKALFYADLCGLRDTGHLITQSGYIALPQGPVVNHYERALVRDLDRLGLAEQTTDGWEKPLVVRCELDRYEALSKEEVGIAQLVARKIHRKTAAWVSDYSHENDGWIRAFRQGTGSGIDMIIALQQIMENDPWLDTAEDEAVQSALTAATDEPGVPF
ncbi:MAG: type II toxin-antitoxin system antitoxin SocA domain-containing protein [Planctomycetota bacterium]